MKTFQGRPLRHNNLRRLLGKLGYRIPEGAKRFSAHGAILGKSGVTIDVSVDGERAFRSEGNSGVNEASIDILLPPGSQILEIRTDSTTRGAGETVWTESRFFP